MAFFKQFIVGTIMHVSCFLRVPTSSGPQACSMPCWAEWRGIGGQGMGSFLKISVLRGALDTSPVPKNSDH